MKKIGILGGLAWPTTIEYYRAICEFSQQYHSKTDFVGPSPMPEMCIESVNLNYSYNQRGQEGNEDSWKAYDAYFNSSLKRLESNGVDFAIIASNTPHNRFDSIISDIKIPILNIFKAVTDLCKLQGINHFLLLGTEPTMNSGVFPKFAKDQEIEAFTPIDFNIQSKVVDLISELFKGKYIDGKSRLQETVNLAYEQSDYSEKIVCLACTELPIAFKGKEHLETFEDMGILYLNTTIIHAKAAFQYAVKEC